MRTKFAGLAAAGLLALSSVNASAAMLTLTPEVVDVTMGVPFDVTVEISGLGNMTAPALGAFDLDIVFDPTVLMQTMVVYGAGLSVGVFGQIDLPPINLADGLNIAAVSFEDPLDLEAMQPGAFTLATITFDPLVSAMGVTLALRVNALGDAFGDPLSLEVPAPASLLLLLGPGLLLVLSAFRRHA